MNNPLFTAIRHSHLPKKDALFKKKRERNDSLGVKVINMNDQIWNLFPTLDHNPNVLSSLSTL